MKHYWHALHKMSHLQLHAISSACAHFYDMVLKRTRFVTTKHDFFFFYRVSLCFRLGNPLTSDKITLLIFSAKVLLIVYFSVGLFHILSTFISIKKCITCNHKCAIDFLHNICFIVYICSLLMCFFKLSSNCYHKSQEKFGEESWH